MSINQQLATRLLRRGRAISLCHGINISGVIRDLLNVKSPERDHRESRALSNMNGSPLTKGPI